MLLSSFFTRSMVFTYMRKAQLLFALFSETFLTIRQNSLYVTVCMIVCTFYQGYFIHSLSTLYYYNAPSLATRLTGDYRDRTYTGKCSPALLDTRIRKAHLHRADRLKMGIKIPSPGLFGDGKWKRYRNCTQKSYSSFRSVTTAFHIIHVPPFHNRP